MAASTLVLVPASARAQAVTEPETGVAEVVVTGSNIRTRELSAPVPLQVLGREELGSFGASKFSDVLKTIPSNSGSEAFTEASPRAGASQFNLRGLGYSSTLTLVNGRRAGISPVSDETGADFTDVNQFPLAFIQRVDVLKDGASAIYGSDAVAGVVNIITRQGFDGLEVSGGYQESVSDNWNLNLALGRRFNRGFISVYGSYYEQTGTDRTDFDWLVERIGGGGAPGRSQLLNANGAPGTYRLGGRNAQGQPIGLSGAIGFADPDCEAAGGVFRVSDTGAVDRNACLVDFADQVGIIPAASRAQVFAEAEYEIREDIKVFGEASFSRNVLTSTRGPGSYGNGAVVANAAGNIFIPASHPFNFFKRDPANANRLLYVDPDAWNPAVDQAVDLVASSRIFGAPYMGKKGGGERRTQTDYFRLVGGAEIELPNDWRAAASYQFASADLSDQQDYRFRADALNAALLAGTLNPFGTAISRPDLISPKDGQTRAGNSQAILEQVLTTSTDVSRTEQQIAEGVVSGPLFELAGGKLGVALGVQYRKVSLHETPDALQASGRGDNPTIASGIHESQDVVAAYAEVAAPILDRLDVQAAVRYEDYGGAVGSSIDPKLAARLTPFDGFSLRGSLSTSFQAPTIRQTSESLSRLFVTDPTTFENGQTICRSSGRSSNPLVRTSGSADLKPQSSRNLSFGVVMSRIPGLTLSVDYWRYRYTDLIAPDGNPQAIVNADCADGVVNDPRVIRDGAGLISEIRTSYVNVGRVITDGLDFAAGYSLPLGDLGDLSLSADVTYLNKFNVYGGAGGAFDGAGSRNFANNFRTMPKWRGAGTATFARGPVSATVGVRYIDGYKNDQSNNAPVSSWTTVDLSVSYALQTGLAEPLVLTVGADNLLDTDPPSLIRYNAQGQRITGTVQDVDRPGYDAYSGVDIRGRILYARFKQVF